MKKSILIVMFLCGAINFLVADEVRSFATQREQEEYVKELIGKLPPEPKLMTEREARAKIKDREVFIAWLSAMGQRGRFVIIGKVVDEHENLLQGVSVEVTKSESGMWTLTHTTKKYELSNYFLIYIDKCENINIYLKKEGYISMVSGYYYGFNTNLFHRTQKDNISIKGNLILGNNLTFVMKKKGDIFQLQKFDGKLGYDEATKDYEIFLMNSWKKSLKQKEEKEPYLQVKSEIIRENPSVTTLELVSSNPLDGFIERKFDDIVKTYQTFWELMGEAPDEKYTTKSLKINPRVVTPAFFYYFINGKYGKGFIVDDGLLMLYQNNEKDSEKKRSLWKKYGGF